MSMDSLITSDFTISEVSMDEVAKVSQQLNDMLLSDELRALPTRGCEILHLINRHSSNVLNIESKEQRGFLSKQVDRVKKRIYRDVGRMFFVYCPIIQKESGGLITLKLRNTDSGEVSDLATDIPANEAFILMDRWGRSLVEGAKLQLLYSVYCPALRPNARIGELMVFWDERMSHTQVYSDRGSPIMFPIEETKPRQYISDKRMLLTMVRSRIESGSDGKDIDPELVRVERISGSQRKILTIKPKDLEVLREEGSSSKGISIKARPEALSDQSA
nr:movement protein [Green Sichuan pepper ilarvirus]